jgi:hypothetical protein
MFSMIFRSCGFLLLVTLPFLPSTARSDESRENSEVVFLLPYFLGNGETGVYFAYSHDGLKFDWMNGGKVVVPAQPWGDDPHGYDHRTYASRTKDFKTA